MSWERNKRKLIVTGWTRYNRKGVMGPKYQCGPGGLHSHNSDSASLSQWDRIFNKNAEPSISGDFRNIEWNSQKYIFIVQKLQSHETNLCYSMPWVNQVELLQSWCPLLYIGLSHSNLDVAVIAWLCVNGWAQHMWNKGGRYLRNIHLHFTEVTVSAQFTFRRISRYLQCPGSFMYFSVSSLPHSTKETLS